MKDRNDNSTLDAFPAPRRGRPKSGNALSNAEKQRRYRERQKLKAVSAPQLYTREQVQQAVQEYQDIIDRLQKELASWEMKARAEFQAGEAARAEVIRLCRLLDSSAPINNGDVTGKKVWRIQKRRNKGAWKTQKGAYEYEHDAIEALIDLPGSDGAEWRVIQLSSALDDTDA